MNKFMDRHQRGLERAVALVALNLIHGNLRCNSQVFEEAVACLEHHFKILQIQALNVLSTYGYECIQ